MKLFTRLHQRIELTKSGEELLDIAIECFGKLADVTNSIAKGKQSSRIHLCVSPLFSANILMPRIGEFLSEDAETEVVIHHSLAPPSDRETIYDVKLFFSGTRLSDESYEFLLADKLIPMCIPALLRKHEDQPTDQFLQQVSIVHEFDYQWWEEWCEAAGIDKNVVRRGIALDDPSVLENAALLGRGIILGSKRFLSDRLRSGELVAPFGEDNGIDIFYYLFLGKTHRRGDVARFVKWLRAVGAELRDK